MPVSTVERPVSALRQRMLEDIRPGLGQRGARLDPGLSAIAKEGRPPSGLPSFSERLEQQSSPVSG